MTSLIITNGDSAGDLLAAAGKDGTIVPWRDVLHEGPIVGGGLEDVSVRALVPGGADRPRPGGGGGGVRGT